MTSPFLCSLIVTGLVLLAGCDNKPTVYPVTGSVRFADGSPLAGGTIEFRNVTDDIAKQVNAHAEIGPDGMFKLEALVGEHEVVVFAPPSSEVGNLNSEPKPSPLQRKFMDYKTSGLRFEVLPNNQNTYDIPVGTRVPGSY